MAPSTIVIKRESNSFERYYSAGFEKAGIKSYDPYRKLGRFGDFICHVFMHFNLPFHGLFYGKWHKEIKNVDMVIIFDWIYSHQIINDIRKANNSCRIVFWFWNKIEPRMQSKIIEKEKESYWSFDPNDVEMYGIKYNTQFYAISNKDIKIIDTNTSHEISYDVFFCGKDKGRAKRLSKLIEPLKKYGIKYRFLVNVEDNTNKYDGIEYIEKDIDYEKLLDYINKSKCILDLTNKEQSGLTIRALEAFFSSVLLNCII